MIYFRIEQSFSKIILQVSLIKMFTVATLLCFLVFSTATLAQNVDTSLCQCYNSTSGAQWLETEAELCSGCDPEVRRSCRLSNGGIIRCRYRLSCNISRCSGHWGPWDNNGPCNNDCGRGFQKQKRICYRVSFKNINIKILNESSIPTLHIITLGTNELYCLDYLIITRTQERIWEGGRLCYAPLF